MTTTYKIGDKVALYLETRIGYITNIFVNEHEQVKEIYREQYDVIIHTSEKDEDGAKFYQFWLYNYEIKALVARKII